MKAVITSDGCEQLAVHNLAPALDVPFYHIMDWDKLWGTPLEPELGIHPECLIVKGFFVSDYSGLNRMYKIMGDQICNFEYVNRYNKDNCRCKKAEKVVILWAGSDLVQMWGWRQFFHKYEAKIFRDLRTDRFVHIPVSEKQRIELGNKLDIEAATALPTPCRELFTPLPLPERFTVGVYLPTYRADMFRYDLILKVAEAMPDTRFIFFHWMFPIGSGEISHFPDRANCEFRYNISREQYKQVIKDSCCLLRIPMHEGLSGTCSDFLMAGRPVVSCHDMPEWAAMLDNDKLDRDPHSADKIVNVLKRLTPEVPEETRGWYTENLDPAKYKERFNARIKTTWPEFQL